MGLRKYFFIFVFCFTVFSSAKSFSQEISYTPIVSTGVYGNSYYGCGWYPVYGGNWYWRIDGVPMNYSVIPFGYQLYPQYSRDPLFASIAYSPSMKKFGVAWGQETLGGTQGASEAFCGEQDCNLAVWVQGGCAALARPVNDLEEGVAFAYHRTRSLAKSFAMRECKKKYPGKCKLLAWTCAY